MKNPFLGVLRASRLSRKGRPLSAALALQQALLPHPKPKRKRAPASSKRAKPPTLHVASSTRSQRPAPGSFSSGQHDGPHGAISYRLYMPHGSDRRRLPLVVMLHGCTQTAADFAAGTGMNALADELGFVVLYPEQSPSANLHRCWNWHRPADQRRGSGEPAAIAALTLHAAALCRANPARIYIAGISAGGSAAAITGRCYPDIYAAVGLHSAVASGNVETLPGALSAMRTGGVGAAITRKARLQPIIIFHGDSDRTVHPGNAAGFVGAPGGSPARTCIAHVRKGQSDGGRAFTRTLYRSPAGKVMLENWTVHGGGHAWFGGSRAGSYTDPAGPDASREMIRFFLAHRAPPAGSRPVPA